MSESKHRKNETIYVGIRSYQENTTPPPKGGEWIKSPTFKETLNVLAKSFAGTTDVSGEPFCDWIVNHFGKWYNPEVHASFNQFIVGFMVYEAMKSKCVIISKQINGKAASAAVAIEHDPQRQRRFSTIVAKTWISFKAICYMLLKQGIPEGLKKNRRVHKEEWKHFEKKVELVGEGLPTWHKEDGPQQLHWYVKAVGVEPEQNGQGLGRELMEELNRLADEAGVPCYLECGATKRRFYEKMGYKVSQHRFLEDPIYPERPRLDFYTMVRMPETIKEV